MSDSTPLSIAGLAALSGGLPTHDPALEAALRRGLDDVEGLLTKAVSGVHEAFGDASGHLMTAGGKRFRPLLTVLASQLGEGAGPDVVRAAAVVELTHLASLYHDDVMDEAGLRRGTLSANAQYGNTVAILTGDLLFARASSIVAELGPEAVQVQAATFERLVTGQTRETVGPTAGRFGAEFAGCSSDVVEVMIEYGERIGVAFQLADDLIDLASDTGQSGKTPGTDLREGVPTLPVLLARASADPADAELHTLLDGDLTDDVRHGRALALLRVHPALEQARVQTVAWADAARTALTGLPEGPVRDALDALAEGVVTRDG